MIPHVSSSDSSCLFQCELFIAKFPSIDLYFYLTLKLFGILNTGLTRFTIDWTHGNPTEAIPYLVSPQLFSFYSCSCSLDQWDIAYGLLLQVSLYLISCANFTYSSCKLPPNLHSYLTLCYLVIRVKGSFHLRT